MKFTAFNREFEFRVRKAPETTVAAALGPSLAGLGAPDDEQGFRRIGGRNTLRELNPAMQRRMQDICYYVAVCTPFGEGIIRVMTDYIVGEGFQLAAEHPDLQEFLDAFANDPVNNLAENLPRMWRELLIFGDQCLPVVENPVDGFIRLGSVDPGDVEAVEFGTLITGTQLRPVSLPVNVKLVDLPDQGGARLRIAQTEKMLVSARAYDGVCFYFAINQARAASRGISELFVLADWVDVFDQMIFDFADRVRFLNAFVWEYILKGADDKKVDEYLKYIRAKNPPRQGGFQVHNDSVEMKTITPDFKGADMSEVAKMMKAYGPGAKSLPPWFFGDPMDANRAANEVMEGPSGKMLTNKQGILKRAVRAICDYAIARAKARGTLLRSLPEAYKVMAPDISVKDTAKIAGTLQTVGNALGQMEDRGWIRAETAARGAHLVLSQIGVEVDSQKEFTLAQEEKADREAQEIDRMAGQEDLARELEMEKQKAKPN
ncbi:MAG TPA: hypothetical protein VNL38_00515 [Candidatus Nitrosotenuis sp.]|nr:hypothetical protein [Candidatus Nitrosotenuis sp.]